MESEAVFSCSVRELILQDAGGAYFDYTGTFCDMLEAQPTGLKGLLDVHSFVCEQLQQLACDGRGDSGHRRAAAMLFGKVSDSHRK